MKADEVKTWDDLIKAEHKYTVYESPTSPAKWRAEVVNGPLKGWFAEGHDHTDAYKNLIRIIQEQLFNNREACDKLATNTTKALYSFNYKGYDFEVIPRVNKNEGHIPFIEVYCAERPGFGATGFNPDDATRRAKNKVDEFLKSIGKETNDKLATKEATIDREKHPPRHSETFNDEITDEEAKKAHNEVFDELLDDLAAPDYVNNPKHYTAGNIETIDYIIDALGFKGASEFCRGNVIKYTGTRLYNKSDPFQDAQKAQWYMNKMVELMEKDLVERQEKVIKRMMENSLEERGEKE